LTKFSWRKLVNKGDVPQPKTSPLMDSYGYSLFVSGGKNSEGIISETHSYSTVYEIWQKTAFASPAIFTRSSSCLASNYSYFLLYGGVTGGGVSSDLWQYDVKSETSKVLSPIGDVPPALRNINCFIEEDGVETLFTIYGGSTESALTQSGIYRYSMKKNEWRLLNNNQILDFSLSGAVAAKIGSRLITAGGQISGITGTKALYEFDLNTRLLKKIGELPRSSYYGGFVYIGSTLYFLYGATTKGSRKITPDMAHSDFFRIELNEDCDPCDYPCSPGTYSVGGGKCELCPPGTYNEAFGASSCQKCPAGTFSSNYGITSLFLCVPCNEGSFSDAEGSKNCKLCKEDQYCPIGSVSSDQDGEHTKNSLQSVSVQPKKYDDAANTSSMVNYSVTTILAIGFTLFAFLLYQHCKGAFNITKLDIFRDSHNYFKGVPMTLKTTTFGAVFSALFIICALCLASVALIAFVYENIEETKSLVPFAVLLDEVDEFTGDIEVTLEAYSYFDNCSSGDITATPTKLKYSSTDTKTSKSHSSCLIKFFCNECVILTGATVSFTLDEFKGYSSLLKVNVTASSSIPDEVSSLTQYLYSPAQEAFRGNTPSMFEFEATASVSSTQLFTSNLNNEGSSTKTGYHITTSSLPISGSSKTNYK
jgi:hypothetical protein